jgi:FMNH2-dependent dimethyl sulfone monooxygenase
LEERTVRRLGDQKFKLGVFAANRWAGLTFTLAPERWDGSWSNQVTLAKQAEAAGFDFLIPLGTWLGLNGDAETDGYSYETLTWAAGLLAETKSIEVLATVCVAFLNPVLAAKQAMTCDHIGKGRFGLNITTGFNPNEFEAFGLELGDHDRRYDLADAWLDVVEGVWLGEQPFDVSNEFFELHGVAGGPAPYGGERPTVVSAGASPAGQRFAAARADYWFIMPTDLESAAAQVSGFRELKANREIEAMGSCHVFCRPTRAEAEEYHRYLIEENGDWKCADTLIHNLLPGNTQSIPDDLLPLRERFCAGMGTYPIVGSPDDVAKSFQRLHAAGLNGMACALPGYLDDVPLLGEEVLPRLEQMGLRKPAALAV